MLWACAVTSHSCISVAWILCVLVLHSICSGALKNKKSLECTGNRSIIVSYILTLWRITGIGLLLQYSVFVWSNNFTLWGIRFGSFGLNRTVQFIVLFFFLHLFIVNFFFRLQNYLCSHLKHISSIPSLLKSTHNADLISAARVGQFSYRQQRVQRIPKNCS